MSSNNMFSDNMFIEVIKNYFSLSYLKTDKPNCYDDVLLLLNHLPKISTKFDEYKIRIVNRKVDFFEYQEFNSVDDLIKLYQG